MIQNFLGIFLEMLKLEMHLKMLLIYISTKKILHVYSMRLEKEICEKLVMQNFCIIVDECLDEFKREQMTIV